MFLFLTFKAGIEIPKVVLRKNTRSNKIWITLCKKNVLISLFIFLYKT